MNKFIASFLIMTQVCIASINNEKVCENFENFQNRVQKAEVLKENAKILKTISLIIGVPTMLYFEPAGLCFIAIELLAISKLKVLYESKEAENNINILKLIFLSSTLPFLLKNLFNSFFFWVYSGAKILLIHNSYDLITQN